ncbi:MAG: hypothetical protein LBI74_00425 [Synergistaceae bacterium]|jgi:hypothetical protein|nr:hypothetical protein [Synergistaceae bacterium]
MADFASDKKSQISFSSMSPPTRKGLQRAGKNKMRQLLIIVALFASCVASFYFFRTTMMLLSGEVSFYRDTASTPDPEVVREIGEMDSTQRDMISVRKASSFAMQTALLAEVSGRLPIAPTSKLAPPITLQPEILPPEIVIEPDPPRVTVIAIMITDGEAVAMIDVLGEEGGLIVRRGSSFSDGSAKITKIDAKGVTFTWRKKNYIITM